MSTRPQAQDRVAPPTSVVRDYFAAFGRGDLERALALMTEDVVWHVDGDVGVSTVGLLRGRAQVRRWLERFPEHFAPREFAIDHFFETDGEVIAAGRFRHTVLSTGRTIGSAFVTRFTVRDGEIVRYQILEDSLLLARAFDPAERWDHHQIRVNGTTYAYADRGEGPVIIFVHGPSGDRTMFDAHVAALEGTHRCIALDMPGHGQSGLRAEGWTLDNVAGDLALMIDELPLGPVAFVGQGQGGDVGIQLATHRPELVSHLVLIDTSARADNPAQLDGWRARLPDIVSPTLVLCGNSAHATSRELCREIADLIPDAQLKIVAGDGHHPSFEASQDVSAALVAFLGA